MSLHFVHSAIILLTTRVFKLSRPYLLILYSNPYNCFSSEQLIIRSCLVCVCVSRAQAVGWPPVRSFRKNILAVQAALVKVSMDGAPYLRKVDIGACKSYRELSKALEKMFSSFTMAAGSCGGMKGMNESKLLDLLSGSDYVPTYEDKDGDWMLVGDVPWE